MKTIKYISAQSTILCTVLFLSGCTFPSGGWRISAIDSNGKTNTWYPRLISSQCILPVERMSGNWTNMLNAGDMLLFSDNHADATKLWARNWAIAYSEIGLRVEPDFKHAVLNIHSLTPKYASSHKKLIGVIANSEAAKAKNWRVTISFEGVSLTENFKAEPIPDEAQFLRVSSERQQK